MSFRRLTTSPNTGSGGFDTDPDVSPDGRTVAFARVLDATPGTARSAVFTLGLDGRGLHQLTPYSLNAIDPRWSPDGSWLAFSSNADNFSSTVSAEIHLVRPDGTQLTTLTEEPPGHQSFTPAWAPRGHRLVYAHNDPELPGVQLLMARSAGAVSHAFPRLIFQGQGGSEVRPDWK